MLRQLFGSDPENQPAVDLVDRAIEQFRQAGADLVDPILGEGDFWQEIRNVSSGDGEDSRVALEFYFSTQGAGYPLQTVGDLLESGGFLGRLRSRYEHDLGEADLNANRKFQENLRDRSALRAHILELMDQASVDVLVYPHETKPARTVAMEVPNQGESPGPSDKRGPGKGNTISSASGLPTIVVPIGFNEDGVGVGLEFLGRLYDESTVIRVAAAFEALESRRVVPDSTPMLDSDILHF